MKHYLKIFLFMILGTSAVVAIGQENDDLYFTKKDRVKQKKKFNEVAQQYTQQSSQAPANNEELSFLGQQFKDSNPVEEGFVSPESLEFYQPEKTQEDYKASTYSADNQYQNANFSNPQETFVGNTLPQQVVVNNYYNDNWNQWNRPRWSFGLGFNNWGGSFWNVSYGNAWGNPWYDPFWDPWGPAWGWNAGWGWNSWAYNPWGWNAGWGWRGGFFGGAWCPPLYGNYYGRPVYVVGNEARGRRVVRSSRSTRGSSSYRSNRSSSGRRAVASESNSRADYSRQQADYLNRARSSRYNSSNARGSSNGRVNSVNSRSSNATNSSIIRNNRSTNSNNSINRSSNSSRSSRSFSTPPARSSRGSSARPAVRSRGSSGSVGRSRGSSGRSSGSRSSSGRSSSRRGRN